MVSDDINALFATESGETGRFILFKLHAEEPWGIS